MQGVGYVATYPPPTHVNRVQGAGAGCRVQVQGVGLCCHIFPHYPTDPAAPPPPSPPSIRLLPGWWSHVGSQTVFDDDQIFLHIAELEVAQVRWVGG